MLQWWAHVPLAVGTLVVYTLGIPLGFLATLVHHKRKHGEQSLRVSTFGFFVKKFRSSVYFWELVIMVRKLCVLLAAIFFVGAQVTQAVVALMVLFCCLMLTIYAQPYKHTYHNALDIGLLISNFVVLFSGVLFEAEAVKESESLRNGITAVVVATIAVSGVVILCVFAVELRHRWHNFKAKNKVDPFAPDQLALLFASAVPQVRAWSG